MKIIAISGPVGVGKNSLTEIIGKKYLDPIGIPTCHLPIAFQLKKELEPIIRKKYNLDVFSEDRKEKKIFRDDLINYAESKRAEQPTYWINKWFINAKILLDQYKKQYGIEPIFLISDLRHAKKKRDDIDILKENYALTIYLEQYEDVFFQMKCVFPYRESEEENDLLLKQKSDLTFRWVKDYGRDYYRAFEQTRDKNLLVNELRDKLKQWKYLK